MSGRGERAVVLVAIGLFVTAGAAGTAGAFDRPGTEQVDVESDSTQLNIALQSEGTAAWEVEYRIRLTNQSDREAFESLRQNIRTDSTPYTDRFGDRMGRIAASAENATDREMAIRNVTVETRTQPSYGILAYRFTWSNFAAVEGDTVRAGDAIDQFYLDSRTTLAMSWPEGYVSDSVTPEATTTGANSVVWEGELDFDPEEPRVVVVPQGETPPAQDTTTSATGGGDGGGGSSLGLVAGLVALVLAVGAGGWWYTQRGGGADAGSDDSAAGGGAAKSTDTGTDETVKATDSAAAGPPMELLSNEEKVLWLVEENGGRMKQKQVAEELDWTAAKTSQVVGGLRDEEKLESFRLGRENVLTLPDVDLEPGSESGDDG